MLIPTIFAVDDDVFLAREAIFGAAGLIPESSAAGLRPTIALALETA
jgi:hypothetical protein